VVAVTRRTAWPFEVRRMPWGVLLLCSGAGCQAALMVEAGRGSGDDAAAALVELAAARGWSAGPNGNVCPAETVRSGVVSPVASDRRR
jgi:hypothetical protein